MLLRKTTWFWKSGLAAISFVLILSISGCSDAPPEENTVSERKNRNGSQREILSDGSLV